MSDERSPQARNPGPASSPDDARQTAPAVAPAAARRPPPPAHLRPAPARTPAARADAGAVLRRSPDPDRPGSWRIAQPAVRQPSIVDTTDGSASATAARRQAGLHDLRSSSIVDTADGRSHPSIVDTEDRYGTGGSFRSIVDAADIDAMPVAPPPVPTRLKGPDPRKRTGPSGPDDELIRRLREARKRKVADRAKSRGRDPGAGSKQVSEGVTRSERTHEQYLERGRMLVKRYRRERGLDDASLDNLDPIEFVNWFFSLKPTLKPTAWRPYRQAAKAILSSLPHEDVEEAISMIDADVAEQSEPRKPKTTPENGQSRSKLPRRTSSLKEKRFPKEDFEKAINFLKHFSRSKFAPVLVDWMTAGIATGLRPIEWQATDIEIKEDPSAPRGRYVWLYVLNAKATNGRANGVVRTLDLSQFRDETVRAVQRMSAAGNEWLISGTYDSMQSQCAQLLYSVSDKISRGKRVYSLYSLRHQFVANAKSYHRPEAVSALVGHVVTDTAISSYGKVRSSWGPDDIQDRADPVPEEVATVRQRLVFFEERVRLQQEAGLIKAPKAGQGEDE